MHGKLLTHIWSNIRVKLSKYIEQLWISFEFWNVWSNYDQSLWILYKTFRLVQCCLICGHNVMHQSTPSRAALHDVKRDFGRCFTNGTLNLSFCMNLLKISNQSIGRAWCKLHLACDCAPLCQIWTHLNNARWINGPQEANWGRGTWSTHTVPQPLRVDC